MQKSKDYNGVKFSPEVISQAVDMFISLLNEEEKTSLHTSGLSVAFGSESWKYDSQEEFYSDCRKNCSYYTFSIRAQNYRLYIEYIGILSYTRIIVEGKERGEIQNVFEVFEANADKCKLPEPKKKDAPLPSRARIFIGHGNSSQWRDLKDYLHEKHGYDVKAYEIGARGGHTIRDILEDMLSKSSFAILVMTGEDMDEKDNLQFHQNVIHELGLFQGRIGFSRAIVLLEEDTEDFSNVHGIQQVRYGKGNIKETFGDTLATLRSQMSQEGH